MSKECLKCNNEYVKENFKYCSMCGIKLETAQEILTQEQSNSVAVKKKINIYGMNIKIELKAIFNDSIIGKPVKKFTDEMDQNFKFLSAELVEKVNKSFS